MRFAWISNNSTSRQPPEPSGIDRLILVAYNVVWWVPVALPVVGLTSYSTGFVAFLAVTMIRAFVNLYRNNVLPLDQGARFPLRLP